MHACRIAYAGQRVALRCLTPAARDLAEFLFGDLPGENPCGGPERGPLRLTTCGPAAALRLGRQTLYRGRSGGDLAVVLLNAVIQQMLPGAAGGLALHSAALSLNGRGILLPGASGAGKSTLAAYLTAAGFQYLTDELVFCPPGEARLVPFHRPLCLKPDSLKVLAPWLTKGRGAWLQGSRVAVVPHRLLNPRFQPLTPPPALILFPAFRPGAATLLEPLSAARTGLLLMACLVNARNLERHGFDRIAALARSVPAFRLVYDRLQGVEDRLGALSPLTGEGRG